MSEAIENNTNTTETDWIFSDAAGDNVDSTGEEAVQTVYKNYEDYPYKDLFLYGGVDTYVTSTVISRQFQKLIEEPNYFVRGVDKKKTSTRVQSLLEVYAEYAKPMFDFIVDLEINGINYDPVENRKLNVSMLAEASELDDRIFTSLGRSLNLDSSDDVRALIYGEKGFTPPYFTKSGDDATDGGALLLLAGMDPKSPGNYVAPNPDLQYLVDIAKRKNLVSVHRGFISTYMEDYMDRDMRVRALYNQFGTSTYRLSSSEPNLQNIPRAFGVKRCFNTRPGYVLIYSDFSSAEIKVLASVCGDEAMLKAVHEGLDFHSFAASEMFGIPYDVFISVLGDKSNPLSKEYKGMRQTSKGLGFSIIYGSSIGGIALSLNISKDEAERLVNLYFNAFPKLKEYVDATHDAAKWNNFVVTPLGHRRQFYGTNEAFKYTAAYNAALRGSQNYIIQSSTSVVGAISFYEISKEIKEFGGICVATVHDSILAEVPIQYASRAVEVFFRRMNDFPQERFPWLKSSIGSECEVGYNWQDCTQVKRGVTQGEINALLLVH